MLMSENTLKRPWLVRMHHRMRSLSFAMVFGATALHIAGKNYSLSAWLFLAALLLVYPHVQYWRSLRAVNSINTEMQNLLIDSLLLGIFIAVVEFSDWLTFSVMMGTLVNNAANKGWRGIRDAMLALLSGALVGIAIGGLRVTGHTDWPTTLVCIVGLGGYLLAINNLAFARNIQLRQTRKILEERENELLGANQTLRKNFQEIDELQQQLREQANHDALTGLFNRRYLDSTLERELARCRREAKPLSLIMIDIDHFKKYNDRYGHQAGDECLRRVAQALQASAKRAGDLPARYGGEEFSLVLPDTDAAAARRLAESLRRGIELLAMPHEQSETGKVTISIGLAIMENDDYPDVESLLRAADEALYHAKWGGRNQVQVAPQAAQQRRIDASRAGNFVQLVWHPAYECGHPVIDEQHQMLFRHVNNVIGAILSDRPRSEIGALIDTLMRNAVQHFEDEEAMIAAAGFAAAAEHANTHRTLMTQAVALVSRFDNRDLDIGSLLEFLAHDLVALHMLGADREFFPCLNPGKDFSPPPPGIDPGQADRRRAQS